MDSLGNNDLRFMSLENFSKTDYLKKNDKKIPQKSGEIGYPESVSKKRDAGRGKILFLIKGNIDSRFTTELAEWSFSGNQNFCLDARMI